MFIPWLMMASAVSPVIKQVIVHSVDPPVLDIVGDGSGAMDKLCPPLNSNAVDPSPETQSSCSCQLSGIGFSQKVPVLYHEADLIRCAYDTVPKNFNWVNVTLTHDGTQAQSNEMAGKLSLLDTSLASSFAAAYRFSCHEALPIPGGLDLEIYDPFQSTDPHLDYAVSFYTTNLGKAFEVFSKSIAGHPELAYWQCPSLLTPEKFLSPSQSQDFARSNRMNQKIYYRAPLSVPFDPIRFWVASQSSGVFSVPISGKRSPSLTEPLGYGALPTVTADGKELCPDKTLPIPPGFHWVKVWSFQGSLAPRRYFDSPDFSKLKSIACNPGDWQGTPVFAACGKSLHDGGTSVSLLDLKPGPYEIADRVLDDGPCVHLSDGSGQSCGVHPGVGCSLEGFDVWKDQSPLSPLQSLTTRSIQAHLVSETAPRQDLIYIVTPPELLTSDLQNSTAAALPYLPYRFYSDDDCLSDDPAHAIPGDCLAQNRINYSLVQNDGPNSFFAAGLSPSFAPGGVCVLQSNLVSSGLAQVSDASP